MSGFGCDRNDWGFKAYVGGTLWRFLGMELGYVDMGKARGGGGSLRARGANLSVLANLPVGPAVLFGKVGSTYGFTDNTASAPGAESGKEHGFGVSYGAGVGFDVTARWQIRAEWDRYRFAFKGNGDQVDLYSVGLAYRF